VEVSAARDADGGLALTVADDGAGFGTSTGSGLGLANIRERLQQMYPGRLAALKARPQGGVAAT
jgi:signal transduction histidine kinase